MTEIVTAWEDFLQEPRRLSAAADKLTELTGVDVLALTCAESLHPDDAALARGSMDACRIAELTDEWRELDIEELLFGDIRPAGKCILTVEPGELSEPWAMHLYEVPEIIQEYMRQAGLWPGIQ
jgi:hypothetical protein